MDPMTEDLLRQALAAADDDAVPVDERVAMLTEVAVGLLGRPRSVEPLLAAVRLEERALELAEPTDALLAARVRVGLAVALQTIPGEGLDTLLRARDALFSALEVLRHLGEPEELADAEMRLGLVLHTLAPAGHASLREAIGAYHRALRTFGRATHPREHAILHNNLATAYLALPLTDAHATLREALAVQSFEQALEVVTLEDDPVEYAMLQNNLGNALQHVPTGHRLANLARAVESYDRALLVRTAEAMPVERANTLANKAHALANLPDDPSDPGRGNPRHLAEAVALHAEAEALFRAHGLAERAAIVAGARAELEAALAEATRPAGGAPKAASGGDGGGT